MIAYKFLKKGAIGLVTGFRWPRPSAGGPGDWVVAETPLEECASGIHVCRAEDLPYWMYEELWAIEIEGDVVPGVNALVASRGRLLAELPGWNREGRTRFVEACRDRAAERIRDLPAARRSHADAFMGHMDTYLRLEWTQLGALCAALAVASTADPEGSAGTGATKIAYRAERAWQSRWLVENLGLILPEGAVGEPARV